MGGGSANLQSVSAGRDLNVHIGDKYILPEERPSLFAGVPSLPNHFLGRDELMADLVQHVIGERSLALAVEGLPGVGKTTAAVALAYHRQVLDHFSDGVLWGGLGRVPNVMTTLAEWAEALGGDVTDKLEPESRSQTVRSLIGQKHLLLVIDDTWQWDNARLLRCGGPHCCHVLTTRDKAIAAQFSGSDQVVNVPTLAADPAFALLQKLAPQACGVDPAAARRLSEAVGGLPLALELLGGYLADPAAPERKYSPTAAQTALADLSVPAQRLQLATQRLGSQEGPVTLQQTIELSLEDLPEEIRQVFYALGAFAPKPAMFSWAAAQAVSLAAAHHLSVLLDRNLLEEAQEEDDTQLTLHQTLAEVAAARLPEEARERHQTYYLALVNKDPQAWQWIERNYEQITWAWEQIPETPKTLEWVWALGVYQNRRGLWQDYLAWANRGLSICQANDLRQDEGALLNHIGWVYEQRRQPDKALDYLNRALLIAKEVGNWYGLAATFNNIGNVYNNLRQWDKALASHQHALPIREEIQDWLGLVATLNNIGLAYFRLGQPKKAMDYYQRALLISERMNDRYLLADIFNNIGGFYAHMGQQGQALEYFHRALLIKEEVGDRYGEHMTRYNMGMIFRDLGQLKEAAVQLRRVVELDRLVQHPNLEADLAMLAEVEAELTKQSH